MNTLALVPDERCADARAHHYTIATTVNAAADTRTRRAPGSAMLSLLLFAASAGLRLRGADGECASGSPRPACLCDRCLGLTTDQRKYVTRTAEWVACLDEPIFAVGAEEASGPVGSRCAPETLGRLATVDYVPVIVGSACVPAVQAQFMAGVEGAGAARRCPRSATRRSRRSVAAVTTHHSF